MVPVVDPSLLGFLEQRILRTSQEFGIDPGDFPRPVLLVRRAERPQCQYAGSAFIIFVTAGEDRPQQVRYQIAHEVVHGVLSPTRPIFDWVQEMFAVHIAIRAMDEAGHRQYAIKEKQNLQRQAAEVGSVDLQALQLPFPEGAHAMAFVVGCRLIDLVGWECLKLLGTTIDEQTEKHDPDRWLTKLEPEEASRAAEIFADAGVHR